MIEIDNPALFEDFGEIMFDVFKNTMNTKGSGLELCAQCSSKPVTKDDGIYCPNCGDNFATGGSYADNWIEWNRIQLRMEKGELK